jgi:predicted homoserine dehydrogenase-like protein
MLLARAAEANPLRIGLIGAGKFGSMYLSQIPRTPGMHLLGIADLARPARAQPGARGLEARAQRSASSFEAALQATAAPWITDDWQALVSHCPRSTSSSNAPARRCRGRPHALEAFGHGKHVVNVTVEADAFCGPLLAQARRRCRRGVLPGLWRPAGADLRPGGLGAHVRLPWWQPVAATSGCRTSRSPRPRRCGATTA